jgi:GNAT superfamily N-acetyltransferase
VIPTERIEIEGLRELFAIPQPGVAMRELDGAICTAATADPESRILNRAVGLGLDTPLTEEQLDAAIDFFEELGVTWFVSLAPEAGSDALSLLESQGFVADYAWAKFTRAADDAPRTETALRVECVGAEHARVFGEIVQRCYGFAPFAADWMEQLPATSWRCYLALDGNEPAAAGALYVSERMGYLSFAATLPEHRRKGAQNALLARRIRDAREAGCDLVVTETGERIAGRPSNSYRNIERAGFELAYLRPNYRAPSTASR